MGGEGTEIPPPPKMITKFNTKHVALVVKHKSIIEVLVTMPKSAQKQILQ